MKHLLLSVIVICISMQIFAQAVVFEWAKGLGGINVDYGNAVATDANGNIYTTGFFRDTADMDPGPGIYNLAAAGMSDIFITKLDPNGNFLWAESMHGGSIEIGFSVTADAAGNIYIAGFFEDTVDFDPGPGIYNLSSAGNFDFFILKLDTAGNLIWAKSTGSAGGDNISCLRTDAAANIYITGAFENTVDFDPGTGVYNLTSAGMIDMYIAKLDSAGNFIWAKSVSGPDGEYSSSIITDAFGNVYTTGSFIDSADFDPGTGTHYLDADSGNVFVSKLDPSGNFVWAKNMAAALNNQGFSIGVDTAGNVYVSGGFFSTGDFDPGPGSYILTAAAYEDLFILKLDSSGNFEWATGTGGIYGDIASSIAVDPAGNVYTTGIFYGAVDFDPGAAVYNLTSTGSNDAFIYKLNSNGNFIWAKNISGPTIDWGRSISLDASGDILITGFFNGTADFNPPAGANVTSHGAEDIFVAKYNETGVGVGENNFVDAFNVFPNPTHGDFTIHTGKVYAAVAVSVMNVTGQEVFNASYHHTNMLNVSFKAVAGIYFVEVRSGDGDTGRVKVLLE